MMAGGDEEDEDLPATQPVLPLIMDGVVAYVEVRSGHDNRSRGVKAQLRNLGAKVVDLLTDQVTHVVFNEGLPSTYKKAKKFKSHLVSVLWIEACKEAHDLVPEAEYPPIGQHIYEDPLALKNFKKMKSMQPDFEEGTSEKKIGKILTNIKRRTRSSGRKTKKSLNEDNNEVASISKPVRNLPKRGKKVGTEKTNRQELDMHPELSPPTNSKKQLVHGKNDQPDGETMGSTHDSVSCHPELIDSETSCSSSVIFCGIERPALPQSSRNERAHSFPSGFLKKVSPDDSPMSRNEFVNRLGDLVHMLRNSKENTNMKRNRRKSEGSSESFCTQEMPSSPATSPGSSPCATNSRKKKVEFNLPNDFASNSDCNSASVALLRRKGTVKPSALLVEEDEALSPEGVATLGKVKGSVNAGGEQITFSQIARSYDAFAKAQTDKKSSGLLAGKSAPTRGPDPSILDDNCCSVDLFQPSKEDITSKVNEELPSSEESHFSGCSTTVLVNGSPNKHECSSNIFDRNPKGLFERSASDVSGYSFKENIPSSTTDALEASSNDERGTSPVFVIRKPMLRRVVKPSSSSSDLFLSCSSKINSNTDKKMDRMNSSREHCFNHSSCSGKGAASGENGSDPVQYLNKTVNFLKYSCFPHLIGTPTNPDTEKAIVLAEDTPEISLDAPAKSQCSFLVPPTPETPGNGQTLRENSNKIYPSPSPHSRRKFELVLLNQKQKRTETNVVSIEPPSGEKEPVCKEAVDLRNSSSAKSTPNGRKSKNNLLKMREASFRRSERHAKAGSETNDIETHKAPQNLKHDLKPTENPRKLKRTRRSSLEKITSLQHSGKKLRSTPSTDDLNLPPSQQVTPLKENSSCTVNDMAQFSLRSRTSSKNEEKVEQIPKRRNAKSVAASSPAPAKKRSDAYDECSNAGKKLTGLKPQTSVISLDCSAPTSKKICSEERNVSFDSQRLPRSLSVDSSRKCSQEAKIRLSKSLKRAPLMSKACKVIVCTFLTASEHHAVESSLESLQGWSIEDKVTSRTTHVINSGSKRTVNMLKGMGRGCWLLHQNWIHQSSKSGQWLNEENFELVDFSPAVKSCRLERQALGKAFQKTLFSAVGPVFVSSKMNSPPAKDIKELIQLWGGEVTAARNRAHLVVGAEDENVHSVHALWILDCITRNAILPISQQYEFVAS